MAHHEEVFEIMQPVQIADPHIIGEIMSVKVGWKPGASATNNAYKALSALVELGQLEKGKGFFRIPSCKSNYDDHARLLSRMLGGFIKLPFHSTIFREHTIAEIGLRPDALILLTDANRGLCLVFEAIREETKRSIETKRHVWQAWPEATGYLSQLFRTPIAHFDFVRSDEFNRYLKEVIYENRTSHLRDLHTHVGAGDLREAAA